jgi:hypothetical protein
MSFYDGTLVQWSIRQRKIIKHFNRTTSLLIVALRITPDKKHLFVSYNSCN